jgi:hypothetical protein
MKLFRYGSLLSLICVLAANAETRPPLIVAPSETNARIMVALTHSGRYAFFLPRGWFVAVDKESQTIRVTDPRLEAVIIIRFNEAPLRGDAEKWAARLANERESSRARDRFTLSLLGSQAEVLDLAWIQANSMRVDGRFIRGSAGDRSLDISLISPSAHFESALPALMQLIGSLQNSPADVALPVRAAAGSE